MRKSAALLIPAALLILALSACMRSINPIGSEEDRIFDARLVGAWGSDDATDLHEVTADGRGSYRMVATDRNCHQGTFTVHLTELEGHRFLDIYPDEPLAYENEMYASLLTRTFVVIRIEVTEASVKTWVMDPDWLDEHLAVKPASAARAALDDELLTGPTEQVRKLYLEYFKTPGVLKQPGELVRLSAERAEELRARCESS